MDGNASVEKEELITGVVVGMAKRDSRPLVAFKIFRWMEDTDYPGS